MDSLKGSNIFKTGLVERQTKTSTLFRVLGIELTEWIQQMEPPNSHNFTNVVVQSFWDGSMLWMG